MDKDFKIFQSPRISLQAGCKDVVCVKKYLIWFQELLNKTEQQKADPVWYGKTQAVWQVCQGRCHEVLENMVKVVFNNYVAENHQLTWESSGKGKPNCTKEVCWVVHFYRTDHCQALSAHWLTANEEVSTQVVDVVTGAEIKVTETLAIT